jgi:hypothetical protein
MDFNWGDARTPMVFNNTTTATLFSTSYGIGTYNVNFLGITEPNFGYDTSTDIFTAIADNQLYDVSCSIEFDITSFSYNTAVQVEWVANINGVDTIFFPQTSPTIPAIGWVYVTNFSVSLNVGDTLRCVFTVLGPDPVHTPNQILPTPLTVVTSANETTDATLLGTLRGELGQWEFLKGIMTMFNLVASPDKSNPKNIIIEPYKDMFLPSITGTNNFFDDNSTQLDWTNKIDTTEIKLEVLADLNKRTVFKFVEDDDDYAFNLYKSAVQGHLYGSQVFDASTTTGNLQSVLEGEEEIIAEPFAATVPKPYDTQFPDFITPSIYSYNADDGTSEGFENSPRIMYNNGIKSLALGTFTSCTYYIPAQNGVSSENANAFLQFSHLTDIPTLISIPPDPDDTVDFHFGICQLIQPIGDATPNNLFNTYWAPYFNELYNPDTRTMTLKVNLTPGDLNTFNFYDTVFIKNRLFRVNKIDYKPNELATVEFILIP